MKQRWQQIYCHNGNNNYTVYYFVDTDHRKPIAGNASYVIVEKDFTFKWFGKQHESFACCPNPQDFLDFLNEQNEQHFAEFIGRFFSWNCEEYWGIFRKEHEKYHSGHRSMCVALFAVKLDPEKNFCNVVKNRQSNDMVGKEVPFNPEQFLSNYKNFEKNNDLVNVRNQISELIGILSKKDREDGGYLDYTIGNLKEAKLNLKYHLNEIY